MAFNATFNNISVTSWRFVLLAKETGALVENHQPVASHWQTLSHNFVSSTPRHVLTTLVVTDTDCIGIYKFNYHTITTTTVPRVNTYTQKINNKKSETIYITVPHIRRKSVKDIIPKIYLKIST